MEPVLIDINDYVHSGEGANGESFNHRTDPSWMLKLYNASAPYVIVENEYAMASRVYEAGIPTPRPGTFVTDGNGRFGMHFRRFAGKKSFSRAIGDDPSRVEEYARRFAGMCLKLHSTHVDTGVFRSKKESNLQLLAESPFFSAEDKESIAAFIKAVPDTDTAVHGDLQYSNAIMTAEGDFFIDLGDFGYGHPYFDIGQVYLCSCVSNPAFIREVYHMEPETAAEFWKYFVKGYFGEDSDLEEVTRTIRPYAGIMTFIIDRAVGAAMPEFHALLDGICRR